MRDGESKGDVDTWTALQEELDTYADTVALGFPMDMERFRLALWVWSLALASRQKEK